LAFSARAASVQIMRPSPWLAALVFIASGCAERARTPDRTPAMAAIDERGLSVRVDSGEWTGEPRDLRRVCTPIEVVVVNSGSAPARIVPSAARLHVERGPTLLPIALFGAWSEPELPSPDMLRLALREGELAPGETARGFVFFPPVPRAERNAAVFELQALMPAPDRPADVRVAEVRVPLRIR
jgi:hypothetical protein